MAAIITASILIVYREILTPLYCWCLRIASSIASRDTTSKPYSFTSCRNDTSDDFDNSLYLAKSNPGSPFAAPSISKWKPLSFLEM